MPNLQTFKQVILENIKKLEKDFSTVNLISINELQVLKNFDFFRTQFPQHDIWPVLKSNAYGHSLSQIVKILSKRKIDYLVVDSYLEALELTSKITNIIKLKKGDQVGYGCSFTAPKPMKVGILPVGYFEVFDRKLSNKGFVKYKNQFLPIVGRVCMNLTIVDLKKTNAKRWDEVQIISLQTKDKNSVQNMAQLSDTIVYETLVKINASTRRRVK